MTWWTRVRGLLRSQEEVESDDLHRQSALHGCDSIDACRDRGQVTLRGTIEVLTVHSRHNTPWLEAELSDGTGRVDLIWMGRASIPGVEAGRSLEVTGRISIADGTRRIYNPRYQLL